MHDIQFVVSPVTWQLQVSACVDPDLWRLQVLTLYSALFKAKDNDSTQYIAILR